MKTKNEEPKEKTTEEKLREIGASSMSCIVEMVNALSKESVAKEYADKLDRETCVKLLFEAGIESKDEEDTDELRETVAVNIEDGTIEPDDFEFDEDEARRRIEEDPLSLEVRSGWQPIGHELNPEEFCLLLGTGGPAVRIIGGIDNGSPFDPKLQTQDWFTPWTDYHTTSDEQGALQKYCECFYFES